MDPGVYFIPPMDGRTDQLGIVQREAERLDEVQRGLRGRAQPGDVAGVGRDLGLDQGNVQRQVSAPDL